MLRQAKGTSLVQSSSRVFRAFEKQSDFEGTVTSQWYIRSSMTANVLTTGMLVEAYNVEGCNDVVVGGRHIM